MACNLATDSFNGKVAGDAFLDDQWKCRTCQLTAGVHPLPKPARIEQEETLRFDIKDVIVQGVSGQYLVVHQLPRLFWDRYGEVPQTVFVRDCYNKLYTIVSDLMFSGLMNHGVTLFTGVPGIGKSLFLVYFIYRYLHDNRFTDKRFAVEFDRGNYWYFQPKSEATVYSCIIQYGHHFKSKDFLLLCDISAPVEPLSRSKWTVIFSSPSPLRYKEILKNSPHFKYIIPTWSELELMFLNPEIGLWHKNFVVFGGVPRYVFPRACEINTHVMLDDALDQEGEIIATEFFKFSFGNVDSQQSYMLVHSNPALSVDEDYEYSGRTVYSFASDFIFQKLVKRHEVQMLAGAKGIFNCEAASASYGAVSGNLFEKVCLWLKPLNGRRIVAASLSGAAAITFDVPAESHLLQHDWKTTAELPVNKLILPRIANLEAGDSFFVVNESDSSFSLIIFQITVGESHPVKVNGLCDIWNAFPSNVKHNITRKVLVFIISLHGSLDREQKFITKRGKITTVPHIARDFEQYVCRYQI